VRMAAEGKGGRKGKRTKQSHGGMDAWFIVEYG